MFVIESYLKRPSVKIDSLVKLDCMPDDYLEGVLYLEYNGSVFMDFTHWDIIDQLWAYMLNLIEDYIKTEKAEVYFPDQPIKLKLSKVSKTLVLFSIVSNELIQLTLPKQEFFQSIVEAGEVFFTKLQEYFERALDYSNELRKIEKLKSMIE